MPENDIRPPRSLWERIAYPFRRGPERAGRVMGFFTDTSVCIGCKACQVACKQWNLLPGETPEPSGHSYDNTMRLTARTWRHVAFVELPPSPPEKVLMDDGSPHGGSGGDGSSDRPAFEPGFAPREDADGRMRWFFSSDSCKHCADPPCLRACPTGALVHTEYGGVYLQTDICNGCASCVAACPFGVVDLDETSGHSHKCTLCLDRVRDGLVPACAKTCPTRSIQYGPLDELRRIARSRLKTLRGQGVAKARLYGLDPTATYPALHNIFLLQDEPALYGLPAEPVHPALRLYGDYLRAAIGLAFALGLILYSLSLGGAS